MGLIRFLISFIVFLGYLPGSAAIAAMPQVKEAIEIIKENRKEQTPVFTCNASKSSVASNRRNPVTPSFGQGSAVQYFKVIAVIAFGSSISAHCSKSAIAAIYARLLSVFIAPQRISLHPRHVYW